MTHERVGASKAVFSMLAVLFLVFIAVCAMLGKLPPALAGIYAGASLLAFGLYLRDKAAAIHGRWRTPERTLHMIALLGGWPGALLAQKTLRHKSSKRSFLIMFWITVSINCSALLWFLTANGAARLRMVLAASV